MQLEKIPTAALYNILSPITVPPYCSRSRFTNWGRTFTCTPLAIFEPETEEQCVLILELARREKKRVRFAGVGHSPSDLACTTDYMLRTTRMNGLLEVSYAFHSLHIRDRILTVLHLLADVLCRMVWLVSGERGEELRCSTRRYHSPRSPRKARRAQLGHVKSGLYF